MESHIFREVATYLRRRRLVVDTRIMVEEKLGFFLYVGKSSKDTYSYCHLPQSNRITSGDEEWLDH
jgi:hypothetical protein